MFEKILLIYAAAGWFIHLVFIVHAMANKGKIIINYNHYKEMYAEFIIMLILFISTIIGVIINE